MRVKQKNYEIDHKRTTSKYESLEPNLNKKNRNFRPKNQGKSWNRVKQTQIPRFSRENERENLTRKQKFARKRERDVIETVVFVLR